MPVSCLACRSPHNHPLFCWENVPRSVVGLPRSPEEAKKMACLEMDLRRCAMCGHVFHTRFRYEDVPYETGSNLVYNQAASWLAYQRELAREWIAALELGDKRLLEIGCGDGTFLVPFLEAGATCFAYEPGPDASTARARGVEVFAEAFEPSRLASLDVDAIVCRHVIEHLADPLGFLETISLACRDLEKTPYFLAEVPRIDKALREVRLNDFLYEHVSNFTSHSFRTLFERAGFEVLSQSSRFSDEVTTLVARPRPHPEIGEVRRESDTFRAAVSTQTEGVRQTIEHWVTENRKVALWGGTGKAAALINMFGLESELCPVVVDSDPRKVGAFVPGTGQPIASPKLLQEAQVDAILVCTQWRARDIEREAREHWGLAAPLFVIHRGAVVPLTRELAL